MRRNLLGDVYRVKRRVFKIIFHDKRVKMWTGVFMASDGIQRRAPIKGGEFLDQLVD
jgi:hypothetical protein